MRIDHLRDFTLPATFSILPAKMNSPEACQMLLTIALQESGAKHRHQIRGPARGYWQFERGGGTKGVLRHRSTKVSAARLCKALDLESDLKTVWAALPYNDTLSCGFARLLLWTLPQALATDPEEGWDQYIPAWRPGKPHKRTWLRYWRQAEKALS